MLLDAYSRPLAVIEAKKKIILYGVQKSRQWNMQHVWVCGMSSVQLTEGYKDGI